MKSIINEITNTKDKIILFIDEVHTLVGAGQADGAMDASNMLKPALARGELHCIGATTLDEYRENIEKDAALARRFQPVYIKEPNVNDTISILRGLKEKYEIHHGIKITDDAIVAAANLSNRYINDRFLPDKAIDIIDEAASKICIEISSKPENIDRLNREITLLKIEQSALQKETEKKYSDRLQAINKKIELRQEILTTEEENWQTEQLEIQKINTLKEQLENAKKNLEITQREGNLTKAGELSYSTIPNLESKLITSEKNRKSKLIKEEVSENDVAMIIAQATGIPIDKMLQGEQQKLLHIEQTLQKKIIGQDRATHAVSNAIKRSRAGLHNPTQPIGSFLFLGPTGVGKTELSKALAEFLFDDDTAMIRFDMSEYMEKHSIAKLIGSPPGYIGFEAGGTLTEAVRRRPYQIILFDEIEKAHSDIFNILLQVLDDGRLTDSHGRTVNFANTIIILTSNIGSDILLTQNNKDYDHTYNQIMALVKQHFRPEFINRLDEILLFNKLQPEHMHQITKIQIAELEQLLHAKQIKLTVNDKALHWLANKGYHHEYGARPLKRVIQNELQNTLAEKILNQQLTKRATISVLNDTLHLDTT